MKPAGRAGERVDMQDQFLGNDGPRSHLMEGSEHSLGVVSQPLLTVFELLVGLRGRGCAKEVAGLDAAVPAPQLVQALLFFFELGQREFALPDLAVDLRVELGAVGDELCPFLIALGSEQFRQSLLIAFRAPGSGQHYHLAVSALSHRYRTVNPFGERGHVRNRPRALAKRHRSRAA